MNAEGESVLPRRSLIGIALHVGDFATAPLFTADCSHSGDIKNWQYGEVIG